MRFLSFYLISSQRAGFLPFIQYFVTRHSVLFIFLSHSTYYFYFFLLGSEAVVRLFFLQSFFYRLIFLHHSFQFFFFSHSTYNPCFLCFFLLIFQSRPSPSSFHSHYFVILHDDFFFFSYSMFLFSLLT